MSMAPALEGPTTVDPEAPSTILVGWRQRLVDAEARGFFTRDDQLDIAKFKSCAVGEMFGYPEELGIADVPLALRNRGMALVSAVYNNRFDATERLLGEIEQAAAELA